MLAKIRSFFATRDVLEVETPTLSKAGATDFQIESITASSQALGKESLYLSSSPELPMKRLLAAGYGDIYQISRAFRDKELGRWHQPEFSLLEWYRVGWNDLDLMNEVEDLVKTVLQPIKPSPETLRITYREAFLEFLDFDIKSDLTALQQKLIKKGFDIPKNLASDEVLDLAFSSVITPQLNKETITFVYDFPQDQAALARIKPGIPPVAARFEMLLGGIELANGFDELTDAIEQKKRFEAEQQRRHTAGHHVPPIDKDFISALSYGLPRCSGVAVGLDRLLAIIAGLNDLSQTMSFAHPVDH
tara:strand:+ start:925 stop:1836 length:912 start_codon:yes stop_codon:yes gene_type:complete